MRGKRTPTKIKELKGTFRKGESVSSEMQPPEASNELTIGLINDYANDEWLKVTRILSTLGMLVETDTSVLLAYCNEIGTYFQCCDILKKGGFTFATPNGFEQQRPEVLIGNKALQNAIKLSDKFGFNPAARTKIEAPVKQDKDEFNDI
jgi:P27 family predicted phage terminase small subunit